MEVSRRKNRMEERVLHSSRSAKKLGNWQTSPGRSLCEIVDFAHQFIGTEPPKMELLVPLGVVAKCMARLYDRLCQIGIASDLLADQKEGCGGIVPVS